MKLPEGSNHLFFTYFFEHFMFKLHWGLNYFFSHFNRDDIDIEHGVSLRYMTMI